MRIHVQPCELFRILTTHIRPFPARKDNRLLIGVDATVQRLAPRALHQQQRRRQSASEAERCRAQMDRMLISLAAARLHVQDGATYTAATKQ